MNAEAIARTLQAKGQAMTLSRVDEASQIYDSVSGSINYADNLTFTVYGITSNYNSISRTGQQNDPNSLVMVGDKKVIIAAGVVVPQPGDALNIAGTPWKIVAVDTLNPQGVDLMYTCQVRR